MKKSYEEELVRVESECKDSGFDVTSFDYDLATQRLSHLLHPDERKMLERRRQLFNHYDTLVHEIQYLSRLLGNPIRIRVESELAFGMDKDGAITTESKEENITDVGGANTKVVSSGMSSFSQTGQKGILKMGDFLSRPVRIAAGTVPIDGSQLSLSFNPWDLYTLQPSVRAKLRNFAFLKGNLKLKIAISGSPFHMGRVLVSYQPLSSVNQNLDQLVSMAGIDVATRPLLINYLSQAPGSAFMNVNENVPLEMELPFISPKPMHRLFNASTANLGASDSYADMAIAGDIYMYTLQPASSVATGSSVIGYQIYAWFDEVELGVSTATRVVISTEGEYISGPVEYVSSKIVSVTKALSKLPVVGPYMLATSMISSGIQKAAALMGWSRPVRVETPGMLVSRAIDNGALTVGSSNAYKITLDPKQELSIQPHLCGRDTDDMVIAEIASRPTWFSSFVWSSGNTLLNTLWSTGVTPCAVTSATIVTDVYSQPAACSFAVSPFAFWRGDIVYKFDVVCSKFHRGKIAVYYEPNVGQSAAFLATTISLNKQFVKIVDIQETQTFEIRVNWATYREWLKTLPATSAYVALEDVTFSTYLYGYYNGFIGVVPFTALQSPDDSDVTVNVSIYCDDLQVNCLNTSLLTCTRKILVESELVYHDSSEHVPEVSRIELNPSTADTSAICFDHFGEQPISFRSLLKRFVGTRYFAVSSTGAGPSKVTHTLPIFPKSVCPYGTTSSVTNWDLFSYLRYAYLGVRGGIRYRAIPTSSTAYIVHAGLDAPSTAQSSGSAVASSGYNNSALTGDCVTVNMGSQVMEYEFPFYSNNLFVFPMSEELEVDTSAYPEFMEETWYRNFHHVLSTSAAVSAATTLFLYDFSSAEDFDFLRFQGAPYYSGGVVA